MKVLNFLSIATERIWKKKWFSEAPGKDRMHTGRREVRSHGAAEQGCSKGPTAPHPRPPTMLAAVESGKRSEAGLGQCGEHGAVVTVSVPHHPTLF